MRQNVRLRTAIFGMAGTGLAGLLIGIAAPDGDESGRYVPTEMSVRQYMLAHPEMIGDVQDQLRIAPHREALEKPFPGAWTGNGRGDVTVIVFTDYNCPYCRAAVSEIDRLTAADPQLKVVWRETPVLGPASDAAALAALAAAKQGRYGAFHRAMFAGDHSGPRAIERAARSAGLDLARLDVDRTAPDVAAEVTSNLTLARRLQMTGTPFFVIGNRSFTGATSLEVLAGAVAAARRSEG